MSSIGPQFPPHFSKRKRDDDSLDSPPPKASRINKDEVTLDDDQDSGSDAGYGPKATTDASLGPILKQSPSKHDNHEIALDVQSSDDDDDDDDNDNDDDDTTGPAPPPSRKTAPKNPAPAPAPKRVMGPAPPPAALSERPPNTASDSDSDDDDYGPALPGTSSHLKNSRGANDPFSSFGPSSTDPSGPPKRDDWMLAPPTATGYQERDPTKIKSRKFASGASATSRLAGGDNKGAGGGVSSIWTETPEGKAKRLADAVLGRGGSEGGDATARQSSRAGQRSGSSKRHQDDKIRSFTEQTRGKSLYEEHQAAKKAGKAMHSGGGKKGGQEEEEEDDPSKRAFDREKDMGLGKKITASQRKELLNRASDFGGRFQKGNYL